MVFVSSYALAFEQIWEAQARRNLVLGYKVVSVFGLVDDELADLSSISTAHQLPYQRVE